MSSSFLKNFLVVDNYYSIEYTDSVSGLFLISNQIVLDYYRVYNE